MLNCRLKLKEFFDAHAVSQDCEGGFVPTYDQVRFPEEMKRMPKLALVDENFGDLIEADAVLLSNFAKTALGELVAVGVDGEGAGAEKGEEAEVSSFN